MIVALLLVAGALVWLALEVRGLRQAAPPEPEIDVTADMPTGARRRIRWRVRRGR